MGIGRAPAGARALRDHNRCQAMGGARARNSAPCDAVRSNSAAASSRSRPKTVGRGNDGISAGTNAPARWMSVQIGQQSSARCSGRAGLEGALGPRAARGRVRSRPPQAARRARDARGRTKPRAGTPAQTAPDTPPISNATGTSSSPLRAWRDPLAPLAPSPPPSSANFSYNVTLQQPAQSRFISCVAQNHQYLLGSPPAWRSSNAAVGPMQRNHSAVDVMCIDIDGPPDVGGKAVLVPEIFFVSALRRGFSLSWRKPNPTRGRL